MVWALVDTERDGKVCQLANNEDEKIETYHTLIWVEDKKNELTQDNFAWHNWDGKEFVGEEPVDEDTISEEDPEDLPEPLV